MTLPPCSINAPPMFGEMNGDVAHIMDCDGRKVELWQPKPMG